MVCGDLTVPEDRRQPNGPEVRLHVAVFKSQDPRPAPDPVVYLEGGPGGHALELLWLIFDRTFAPFMAKRDLIMYDQRGVGHSRPALYCPDYIAMGFENLSQALSVQEEATLEAAAVLRCRDRLASEGVSLGAYTSAESAADLSDLRQALGYDEWNLYGISYGTRLALTAMRDFPEGIRSVILDSTYPPQVDLYSAVPPNASRAFDVLFQGCVTDKDCNATYPDLESVFFGVVRELDERPATFPVTNPLTGEKYEALINGKRFIGFTFQSLYSSELIPLLPQIVFDAKAGRFDTFAVVRGSLLADDEFFSHGMYYSVGCGEEVPFSDPEQISAAARADPRFGEYFDSTAVLAICRRWGARQTDPIENLPVASEIPTLVLAGEYDPITPPAWGRLAAETLDISFYYEFPGIGHGVALSGKCPLGIALAFLDIPRKKPDGTCISRMSGPRFRVPASDFRLVPFTSAEFGLTGLVPEGWQEVVPGIHGPSAAGDVAIIHRSLPTAGAEQLIALMGGQLGLGGAPQEVGTREANGLVWRLYQAQAESQSLDLALAQGSGGMSYLIVLRSTISERGLYHSKVYLAAIDALRPLSP